VFTYTFFDETGDALRFREAYIGERRKGTTSLALADKIIVRVYGAHVDSLLVGAGLMYGIFKVVGVFGKDEVEVLSLKNFHVCIDGSVPPSAFEENFTFVAKLTMDSFKVNLSNSLEWKGDKFEEFSQTVPREKTASRKSSSFRSFLGM
jgi:hypothetical protein